MEGIANSTVVFFSKISQHNEWIKFHFKKLLTKIFNYQTQKQSLIFHLMMNEMD